VTASPSLDVRPADDRYAAYYAEKLWNWIPEVHRDADFTALHPNILRALIEVVAGDAATARRGIDRLWENVLIDYADEWAVPYIGELIGTRLLNSINGRGVRVDVANTIFYRRRAGTLVVLDQLMRDITGWSGIAVEAFRRLARHWHGLDDSPFGLELERARTPDGGFADLRSRWACARIDTPFDPFAHHPDFRRLASKRGRYAIPKVNIHLYREQPIAITDSMGLELAPHLFSFDPSGRAIPLFAAGQPPMERAPFRRGPDQNIWSPPRIWNMRAPISRALLAHALFDITPDTDLSGLGPPITQLIGATIEGVDELDELSNPPSMGRFRKLQRDSRRIECGKYELYASGIPGVTISLDIATGANFAALLNSRPIEEIAAADLGPKSPPAAFPYGTRALIDPERGLMLADTSDFFRPKLYYYGQFDPVGATGASRSGGVKPGAHHIPDLQSSMAPIAVAPVSMTTFDEFTESKTYQLVGPLGTFTSLGWQASDAIRPYVLLPQLGGNQAVLKAEALNLALSPEDPANQRIIDIDGLWLTVAQANMPVQALGDPDAAVTPVMTTIVIDATAAPVQQVTLRNVTLDPGGERARVKPCEAVAIPYVRLLLKGEVQQLIIERCITGPIEEAEGAGSPCAVGQVMIRDSIVQSIDDNRPAILLSTGTLCIERSTVLGRIEVDRLYATELLASNITVAADNQHGCFRFSAGPSDPAMRLPRQFESHLIAGGIAPYFFVSTRFGDPGFAQLSGSVPQVIERGAENGSEIGAFSRVLAPIKADDLRTKLDEYAPMNTICGLVFET
jgi:hypothetical protein